jgi:hypothetical protein
MVKPHFSNDVSRQVDGLSNELLAMLLLMGRSVGPWQFRNVLTAHDVRYWHKADMLNALPNVRFWGQSGQ